MPRAKAEHMRPSRTQTGPGGCAVDGARTHTGRRSATVTFPHRTLCPGRSPGQRGPLRAVPPEGRAALRHPVCVECTGKALCFPGGHLFWVTMCLDGRTPACLFLGFPFTFNADWSAGTSPRFTPTDASGTQMSPVSADILHGFLLFTSAGLVRRALAAPGAQAAPSSPRARAGGAGGRVSAGSTVGVDEAAARAPNKRRLAEGTVALLAQRFV